MLVNTGWIVAAENKDGLRDELVSVQKGRKLIRHKEVPAF
jgi:hypothetical protein